MRPTILSFRFYSVGLSMTYVLTVLYVGYVQKQWCTCSGNVPTPPLYGKIYPDTLPINLSLIFLCCGKMYCLVSMTTKVENKEMYLINSLIILGKHHTHKAKFSNSKPSFIAFGREKENVKTIYDSKNKNAAKSIQLCSIFNVCI